MADQPDDTILWFVVPRDRSAFERAPEWSGTSWLPDMNVHRVCDVIQKYGEVWVPNKKQYEDTSERIWCHIKRHTPVNSRILVIVPVERTVSIYQKTKHLHDLGDREITFLNQRDGECRGLNIHEYDYVLLTESPVNDWKWTRDFLLPSMMEEGKCRVFYRHLFGLLCGEAYIEITDLRHPFWQHQLERLKQLTESNTAVQHPIRTDFQETDQSAPMAGVTDVSSNSQSAPLE